MTPGARAPVPQARAQRWGRGDGAADGEGASRGGGSPRCMPPEGKGNEEGQGVVLLEA